MHGGALTAGVTVVLGQSASFRGSRRYVATLDPWLRASVGPQLVSAYVDTVLVRPGSAVKRGEVLATLDCRSSSASSSEVAMRARALEAKQSALAKESARISGLLKGGFVSPNEVEQKEAETASMQAQLLATKAKLTGASLEEIRHYLELYGAHGEGRPQALGGAQCPPEQADTGVGLVIG